MRSRAYRRHKRAVKLARRYRIMRTYDSMGWWRDHRLTPQAMNAHINCNCFEDPREEIILRRRDERAWRREWDV